MQTRIYSKLKIPLNFVKCDVYDRIMISSQKFIGVHQVNFVILILFYVKIIVKHGYHAFCPALRLPLNVLCQIFFHPPLFLYGLILTPLPPPPPGPPSCSISPYHHHHPSPPAPPPPVPVINGQSLLYKILFTCNIGILRICSGHKRFF